MTTLLSDPTTTPYDVEAIRRDFAVLSREVNGRPLVYLDNASSTHKPRQVLDAERAFVEQHYSNVHRGVHTLSQEATDAYEAARSTIAAFIGAQPDEVVFTKNVTESLNLVAYSLGNPGSPIPLGPGDEIVVTEMEHHSNLVPWQLLAERTGATLKWFGLTDEGRLDLADDVITDRTKVVAFVHQSNLLGTINPVAELVARAKAVGALTVVDGAQSVPHLPVDVHALGVDLFAFTGHKMLGPTGVGVLWGRNELLSSLPPFLGGGSMIEVVEMARSTYAPAPERFEAGTPVISQAIALAAACDYLSAVGLDKVAAHEAVLTARMLDGLRRINRVRVIGPDTMEARGSAVSFVIDGVHPHDVGQSLDELGIAVRVGHHCAAPVCKRYAVPATARASSYLYNTEAEIDALLDGIEHVKRFWGVS
ncbi:MAG: cysteine desulfurase / selenocysteine lyase [Actinomycetota bacterium]|jgi:cysteine desulfurase/selenocysteine lyase|nr:cysteine desulfurase / selenocysteine lyase [Actinomycetota bacterium]